MLKQLDFFSDDSDQASATSETSTTFSDNLSLPIHRWFRYSAGFSAQWVSDVIRDARREGRVRVLDPFAGSGTVLVVAMQEGVPAFGVESHPFVARVARAKIVGEIDSGLLRQYARRVLERAEKVTPEIEGYPTLIRKCYPDDTLAQLDKLRRSWQEGPGSDESYRELGWLALASVLRQCSPVGTANWQYILPKKSKAKSDAPFAAFKSKIDQMAADLCSQNIPRDRGKVSLIEGDARVLASIPDRWASLVITSPPYPNNFDYADATRLEMSFFGDIAGWGDLQESVRKHLVRSCTQHVSYLTRKTGQILGAEELRPIAAEIKDVCGRLEEERGRHAGKKNYHTMIAAYFLDMAKVWTQLRRVMSDGRVCFVIGDSAPYGVYVPVDKWMGELALAAGFRSYSFEKTRDRNVKWKNRKHRVPLHEGRLWVEG